MLILDHKLGIYIPSTQGIEQITAVEHTARSLAIGRILSAYFGGGTIYNDCTGFWLTDNNDLILEDSRLAYSFCDKSSYDLHWPDVIKLAADRCLEWYQESIGILDNNTLALYFAGESVDQIIADRVAVSRPYVENWPKYHQTAVNSKR